MLVLAFASSPPSAAAAEGATLEVEIGTHKLLREAGSIERVAVGDPKIADVTVINRRELLLTGKGNGVTSLMVWRRGAREPEQYRVQVGPVQEAARAAKSDAELANAQISVGGGVSGQVPSLLAHDRARQIAGADKAAPDTSVVALETQVMTDIRIAEVNRTTLQEFGLNFFKNSVHNTAFGLGTPGSLSGAAQATPGAPIALSSTSGFIPLRDAFNLVVGNSARNILGVLSLLESKGLSRTLAEPSLMAHSGQTASFLAGGEFPVPVSQSGNTAGAITIEFKEFGVRVLLTPTVLSRDRIALKVAPEVSELDFSTGVQVGGVSVPGLRVRRTDTTVELGDGESFVISGLVSNDVLANVDKVPWLGNIPILGAFFKDAKVSRAQKELIMVVTPHLVRPLRAEAKLPPVPGSKYDRYHPGFAQLLFEETGDFDPDETGFSK